MKGVLQVERDPKLELTTRFPSRNQQGIEHSLAMPAVVCEPAEQKRRLPLARGDLNRVGRLRSLDFGRQHTHQRSASQRRGAIGPRPATREMRRPRVGFGERR